LDYDQSGIATTYDEARALIPARRSHWRRLLSAHVDRTAISLVVDLGCGTGRFSEMLAAEFEAWIVGLDPSEKMIDQARRKPAASPVVFGRAAADKLPLADGRVDLVFMSQIYHHLPDPAAAARECRRLLRVGGYVCIRCAKTMSSCQIFSRQCGPCSTRTCHPVLRSGRTFKPPITLRHHEVVT